MACAVACIASAEIERCRVGSLDPVGDFRVAPTVKELVVNGLAGTICTVVPEESTWAVRDVKAAIETAAQIPRRQQRLLLDFAELRDDEKVSSFSEGRVELTLLLRSAQQAEWLELAEADWSELLTRPAEAWEDAEVVACAVSQCGWALKHAHADLKADRNVVLAAVRQNGLALQHAAPELTADSEVVLAAVFQCGRALQYASSQLQEDRAFILEAVAINGRALEHAAQKLRKDRQVVLAAVAQCGSALVGADTQLRNDAGIVAVAILQDPAALVFASAALRTDPEVLELIGSRNRAPSDASTRDPSDLMTDDDDPAPRPPSGKSGAYFFGNGTSDGNLGMRRMLGKQGAVMCEMANLGLPVAPGFCLTSKRQDGAGGDGVVKEAIAKLEHSTQHYLGSERAPLLLSVQGQGKEGARLSNVGMNDAIVDAWADKDSLRCAVDSYRRLILSFSRQVKNLDMEPFDREADAVKQRLSEKCSLGRAYEENDFPLSELQHLVVSYKGLYQEQAGEPFPQDPNSQLSAALDALQCPMEGSGKVCTDEPQSASAIVQAMVFGNYDGKSAVGVATARFDSKRLSGAQGEWLTAAQHEDVAARRRTPLQLTLEASRAWAEESGIAELERSMKYPSLEEQMPSAYASLMHSLDLMSTQMPGKKCLEFIVQQGKLWVNCPQKSSLKASKNKRRRKEQQLQQQAEAATASGGETTEATDTSSSDLEAELFTGHILDRSVSEHSTAEPESELGFDTSSSVGCASVAETAADFTTFVWPMHTGCVSPALQFHQYRNALRRSASRRCAAEQSQAPASEPLASGAAVAAPAAREAAFLKLPVWQTAFAGGAAGVASQLAARNPGGCARALPTGMICCSFYVNLLNTASKDGDLDSVAAPMRLACAATAATAAVSLTHTGCTAGSALVAGRPQGGWAQAATDAVAGANRSAFWGGLRGSLTKAVPATAIEMCTIDMVKQEFAAQGHSASTGVLLASGAAAGIVSQSLLCLPLALSARGSDALAGGPAKALRPLARELMAGCGRSVPAVAANSLVRVGLVSLFLESN